MSFLGGVLKQQDPSERVELALTRDLQLRRKLGMTDVRFSGYAYRGSADLLLKHGRFYQGRTLPDQYAQHVGRRSWCFLNALEAARKDPDLRYCEGVYTTGYGSPRAHGWCVAPDGHVVEVTMPSDPDELAAYMNSIHMSYLPVEHWGYFGAIFHPDYVYAHGQQLGLPMLDRGSADIQELTKEGLDPTEPHDFPVLKLPYDPNRTELP